MPTIKQITFFWLALAGILAATSPAPDTYQILLQSRVELTGQTNVSQFACTYAEGYSQQQFSLGAVSESGFVTCTHSTLRIPVPQLDCGNVLMNNDLQEAMRVEEFPFIRVKVAEVLLPRACELGTSAKRLTGHARITIFIAEARESLLVPIEARCEQPGQLVVTGLVPLQMSHFGITPPKAMLGMIEVEDAIRVKVELTASWQKV